MVSNVCFLAPFLVAFPSKRVTADVADIYIFVLLDFINVDFTMIL